MNDRSYVVVVQQCKVKNGVMPLFTVEKIALRRVIDKRHYLSLRAQFGCGDSPLFITCLITGQIVI